MDELMKARFREQGDALETVIKFANELSDETAKVKDELARVKAWARTMLAAEIENAGNELRVEISGVLAEGHQLPPLVSLLTLGNECRIARGTCRKAKNQPLFGTDAHHIR